MSAKYPCPAKVEDDCGYPACAHAMQCEHAAWFCDCAESVIRRVGKDHPHPAIDREGWFCMGCLREFVPKQEDGPPCSIKRNLLFYRKNA
jgi:hypothetical protein